MNLLLYILWLKTSSNRLKSLWCNSDHSTLESMTTWRKDSITWSLITSIKVQIYWYRQAALWFRLELSRVFPRTFGRDHLSKTISSRELLITFSFSAFSVLPRQSTNLFYISKPGSTHWCIKSIWQCCGFTTM